MSGFVASIKEALTELRALDFFLYQQCRAMCYDEHGNPILNSFNQKTAEKIWKIVARLYPPL